MRSGSGAPHVDARLAFEQDPLIVRAQIFVAKARQQRPGMVEIVDKVFRELVG